MSEWLITDPIFYATAIPAVLLYGMAKGGLGGAAGAIAVPLMATAIDPVQAAAILLPIICVMDFAAVRTFKGRYDRSSLRILIPAGIAGIVVGSFAMGSLATGDVKFLVGAISLTFCLHYWLSQNASQSRLASDKSGYFWGLLGGFTSTQIHAGGPPISVYLFSKQLDKFSLIGTMAVWFAVVNYLKLIPYGLLGQFDLTNLATSLVLAPLAPIGVRLGYLFLNRIETATLQRVLYVLLFLSGIKLIFDSVLS